MKLILHIGTEKTGTTTLQNYFSLNRDFLKTKGIYYPKTLGKLNHCKLTVFARDRYKPSKAFNRYKIFSINDYRAFSSSLITDFNNEYSENSNIKNWVISDEHLQSRLTDINMVRRVKSFLSNKFENIEILVHLRPQIDLAISLASTAVRVGKTVNSKFFLNKKYHDKYYNYDLLIKRWEDVFGADCVRIVPFNNKPCMTSFLLEKLGIEKEYYETINRKNSSLDWRTMVLVNTITTPDLNKDKSINHNLNIFINDLPYKERLAVGLDIAKQFQSVFEKSNNQLINRRQDLN